MKQQQQQQPPLWSHGSYEYKLRLIIKMMCALDYDGYDFVFREDDSSGWHIIIESALNICEWGERRLLLHELTEVNSGGWIASI